MPYMETPEELADWLATKMGIYADPKCTSVNHEGECQCRVVWVPAMADRIRRAVDNEARLKAATLATE